MNFPFELRPLAEVAPWGGDEPTLHWFALTAGWYWITVEGRDLLHYSDESVRQWELERPYPGYYLARQWEDLILLRRFLQEAVPDDLIAFVDGSRSRRDFPDDDLEWGDEVDAAFELESDFIVDLGHLTRAPHLRCWRHTVDGRDVVTLSQQIEPDDLGTFDGPERLDFVVPAAEFLSAIEDFDRRLIAAMADRVAEMERTGPPPGVALDVAQLRAEHEQRSQWLAQRMATPRHVDWPKVRAGAAVIFTWHPSRSGTLQ
jgi:hypothetical protein